MQTCTNPQHSFFKIRRAISVHLFCFMAVIFSNTASAIETSDWSISTESSQKQISHQIWQEVLDKNLIDKDASRVNLFKYGSISNTDKIKLRQYIEEMASINPREYTKSQQKAYWINVYNALTVQLILTNYPVESITKLGESIFSFGPWDDDAITISGETLSLNDIEHKIIRPFFKDQRIHYAVNCASYSCPNLSGTAYTAKNTEDLLSQGACDYINHPRGVTFESDDLLLSSIYDWYIEDFGGNNNSLIKHLLSCAQPSLKRKLTQFQNNPGDIDYHYDWRLNEAK